MSADAAAVDPVFPLRVCVASASGLTQSLVRTALERVGLAVAAECSESLVDGGAASRLLGGEANRIFGIPTFAMSAAPESAYGLDIRREHVGRTVAAVPKEG